MTKLMHIGSARGKGTAHLKSSIRYIMNPDKTENGIYIGGNSGNTPEEVFDIMMETKREWGKEDKRQGYHFVISFKPGEADADKAYQVLCEFCEEYLGEDYDYVFSIHTDQEHMHGHIVFNSVSRTSGYKYRYEKGDWEKFIQPVTDRICEKYGLPPLSYDKNAKVGRSYAEHFAKKEGRPTIDKIIKADIDHVVALSETMDEFHQMMEQLGYRIVKKGNRKTTLFLPPGFERGRRDSTLGDGYRMEDIEERVLKKETGREPEKILSPKLSKAYDAGLKRFMAVSMSRFQIRFIKRFYLAGHYLEQKNPFAVSQREVRKNALQIDVLYEECRYILEHGIKDPSDLDRRLTELKQMESALKNRRNTKYSVKDETIFLQYADLKKKMEAMPEWDDHFEDLQEELDELEKKVPEGFLTMENEREHLRASLREIRREKKLVEKMIQEEEKEKQLQRTMKKPELK